MIKIFFSLLVLTTVVDIKPELGTLYDVKYLRCFDGDTCTVVIPYLPRPFTQMNVRLRDIDAPEIRGSKCQQEKELANKAKSEISNWLHYAKNIDLANVGFDSFSRLLADVYVDGVHLQQILLARKVVVQSEGKRTQDWCIPTEEIWRD